MAEANQEEVLPTGTENNVEETNHSNSKKAPDWVGELRKDVKNLRKELAIEKAKNSFGENYEEGAAMLSAGMSEDRIKELLNGSKEPDPIVNVNDQELGITKATGTQEKPELTEEEKKMKQEEIDHANDLKAIKKMNLNE